MTNETRQIIDLSDISAFRIECRKCGTAIVRPPATAREDLPTKCANCGADWFLPDTGDKTTAEALIRVVRYLDRLGDQPWILRLELTPRV